MPDFPDMVGHQAAWRRLASLRASGRHPRVLLLTGPAGIGKALMALRLAQAWLCPTGKPCVTCATCHQVTIGVHPDSALLERDEGKTTISIDQVRLLSAWEPLGSTSGRGKVIRVLDLEDMQEPCQSALLKILEEPSAGVLFVLTASRTREILPTLLSRCHVERLSPLTPDELVLVARREGWPEGSMAPALAAGSAGLLKALSSIDGTLFIRHVLEHVAASSPQDCTDIVAGLREHHRKHPEDSPLADASRFVRWMLSVLALVLDEGLRLRAGLPLRSLAPFKIELEALSRRMTYSHMEASISALDLGRGDLELNLDPWAVLEEGFRRLLAERYVQTS